MNVLEQVSRTDAARRILLVDDAVDNREMYATFLRYEGFDVVQAGTTPEALHAIRRQPPALIVFDIALPGQDGLSLCRQVRDHREWDQTALITLTGLALSRAGVEQALEAGAEMVLFKPCLPDRLLREARKVIIARSEMLRERSEVEHERARRLAQRAQRLQEESARLHLRARRILTGLGQEHLVERIKSAYRDTPALTLTVEQCRRQWDADPVSCEVAFDDLVESGWLTRTTDGGHIRAPRRWRAAGDASAC